MLLHGFPSSSREFDLLIPMLATRSHVVAPDFPGFSQSDALPPSSYAYSFDHLAETTNSFLEQLKIEKCIFFLHDYGGPVGFRIMLLRPECVQASSFRRECLSGGPKHQVGGHRAVLVRSKRHPEVFDTFVSFAATDNVIHLALASRA